MIAAESVLEGHRAFEIGAPPSRPGSNFLKSILRRLIPLSARVGVPQRPLQLP